MEGGAQGVRDCTHRIQHPMAGLQEATATGHDWMLHAAEWDLSIQWTLWAWAVSTTGVTGGLRTPARLCWVPLGRLSDPTEYPQS